MGIFPGLVNQMGCVGVVLRCLLLCVCLLFVVIVVVFSGLVVCCCYSECVFYFIFYFYFIFLFLLCLLFVFSFDVVLFLYRCVLLIDLRKGWFRCMFTLQSTKGSVRAG